MSTTGERIRELRQLHNMTLDDVARYLGVGRQAIYKYEQGTVTNIPLENLEKMALLFGTTPGYLAGWSDVAPEPAGRKNDPVTPEARIISGGIDKMPPERREQALKILQLAFSEYAQYFKEEDDDT